MKKFTLLKSFAIAAGVMLAMNGWGQSAVVTSRPTHIDISGATSESAVLMTLSSYSSNDARYRLYNGSNQYYPWNEANDTYISSTSYASGPQAPGTPMTSTTFWIVFQRGNNATTAATYRDRLGTAYSTNYQTIALPSATSITTPFSLTGTFVGAGDYDNTVKHVVLGFNGTDLISAASTTLSTGAFTLVCPTGTTINKIEVRAIDNTSIAEINGSWASTTAVGDVPGGGTPLITVAPTSLSGFTYVFGSGPSAAQTFTVEGSDLTDDITITPPTNYEISETSGSGFTSSNITLTQSDGVVEETTIYVRLKAGLAIGSYNDENITATSTDADNKTVTCSGSVTAPPSITFYFRGPSWMNNNPHNPQIWGPYNGWSAPPAMTFDVVPGWWSVTVTVADAGASIEYQTRFYENGVTKYQKAFGNFGANATFTTTTGEIWIDASENTSFYWQGDDFYLSLDKITENQPIDEPSSHVANFQAAPNSSTAITVTWTDSDASGYLIKGSDVGYGSIEAPVDGTAESDGTLVKNIASGNGNWQFTGLNPSTTYYFKIWPYNGNGASINYKVDGSVPESSATTENPPTYTWIGIDNESWAVSTNWNPTRTTPANNDILQFNDGTTKTITAVPAQTIGKLLVAGNTNVTLQTGSVNTLTIAGGTGDDLVVESGSQLNISGSNALSISLPSGATGSVGGSMMFAGAAHRLLAAAASGITFNSGSVFTAGTSFSGNAFGTTSLNSVIFANGSVYIQIAGSNPFGAGQPNSVVVFQTGSLYSLQGNATPAFSGRFYADFEMDFNGIINTSGSSSVVMNNLAIKQGTLNFNMTATPGHSIKGNIEIMNGATLNFNPASAGTINFNGTSLQLISGSGTLSAGTNSTIVIDNVAGIRLNKTAAFNNITIMPDSFFDIWYDGYATVNGTLTNNAGATGLVIKSDATGIGSLIHNTTGIQATAERYIPLAGNWGIGADGWHFLSSPVAAQAISGVWTPNGSENDYDFFAWDESEVEFPWLNQKDATNETLFNLGFIPGKGYLVAYEQSSTKAFTGALNSGAINFELKNTGGTKNWVWTPGWNFLGNPYPSAIDWNLATRTQFEDNFAYIYNTAKSGGAGYEEIDGGTAGAFIPANQGFFVQASSAANGQNFTFNDNLRVHGGTFYKSDVEDVLQLRLAKGDFYDNTTLRIKAEGSLNRDRMDALKLFSFNAAIPQVYTHTTDGVWVAVNSVPEINETLTIPLSIKVPANGTMTLSIAEFNGVFAEQNIFLVDLLTSVTHNLSQHPEYSFTANTSDSPDRFLLKFEAVGIPEVPGSESLQAWVNGNILYVMNTGASKARVEVYNIHGQLIMAKATTQGLQSLPVNIPPGTYLVKMTSEGATATRKISIQ